MTSFQEFDFYILQCYFPFFTLFLVCCTSWIYKFIVFINLYILVHYCFKLYFFAPIFSASRTINLWVAQTVKNLPAVWETWFNNCQEDPLEKEMATHSNILAWRIPQTWGRKELDTTEQLHFHFHFSDCLVVPRRSLILCLFLLFYSLSRSLILSVTTSFHLLITVSKLLLILFH